MCNTTGNYLITHTCSTLYSGDSNTDLYVFALCNGVPSFITTPRATPPYNIILIATPRINAKGNNKYNYMPSTISAVINITTASEYTFYVYGYNNSEDNNYTVYVTGNMFYLG